MELEETWSQHEAELADAVRHLQKMVELLPALPDAARRSGSVGGAAIAIQERLIQLEGDVRRARAGAPPPSGEAKPADPPNR